MSELWHHGKISKQEAVRRFRKFHPNGSFLMRNSETITNAFVLSVGFQNNVYHYRILRDISKKFVFEGRFFSKLSELVDFHTKHKGCLVCILKHPILPPLATGLETEDNPYDIPELVFDNYKDRGYEMRSMGRGSIH